MEPVVNVLTTKFMTLAHKLAKFILLLSADSTSIGLDAAVFVREGLSKLMEFVTPVPSTQLMMLSPIAVFVTKGTTFQEKKSSKFLTNPQTQGVHLAATRLIYTHTRMPSVDHWQVPPL